jgi:hypothetical protein
MPLQETSGAASYDAFGGGAAGIPNYIEDVFSTSLYTGTGTTQTITNGIDLSGKGGLVWLKARTGTAAHFLFDTTRGVLNEINSNTTDAQASLANSLTTFGATGFTLGGATGINQNTVTMASWTFREQAKFFDVVTYTGTGANITIAHNLGSVPGCIMVKRTDAIDAWAVYHRSLANTQYMVLNTTAAAATGATWWNSTTPTSTEFSLGTDTTVNASGGTYVAYLFAHDAGGFGLTGSDNVISCGSFTTDGSGNASVTLGYEPQWLMYKRSSATENWTIIDNMRGWFVGTQSDARLIPNLTAAEAVTTDVSDINATGFSIKALSASSTFIYVAIRRPMKVPTSGTSVFSPKGLVTLTSGQTVTTGFVTDMTMAKFNGIQEWLLSDRLRNTVLYPNTTDSEGALYGTAGPRPFDVQDGFKSSGVSGSYALWGFRRAPGFMDVVCYTGTGANRTINHNLAAVPELMLVKCRNAVAFWPVYLAPLGVTKYMSLNQANGEATDTGGAYWNNTTPTSSVFSLGTGGPASNSAGNTYVAYLFATVAGVSKVGSYTGTGTTNQINCGFTTGARFVLIKRTDTIGNWHLYDSGQGIVAGNDPYFMVNTSDGQFTGTDYVDTFSSGFELSNTAPAGLNANGGTYIFLAIA